MLIRALAVLLLWYVAFADVIVIESDGDSTIHSGNKLTKSLRSAKPPTVKPTVIPTRPTAAPTVKPTRVPTATPTVKPSADPTVNPSSRPTVDPTVKPTKAPTEQPTSNPTASPTSMPTLPLEYSRFYARELGLDYVDSEISAMDGTLLQCKQECDKLPGCEGFAFRLPNKCSFKALLRTSAVVSSVSDFYRAVSSREYIFQHSTTYPGYDLPIYNVSSRVCAATCDATAGCQGFSFDKTQSELESLCYLKYNLANPVSDSKYDFYAAKGARVYTPIPQYDYADSVGFLTICSLAPWYECAAACDSTAGCLGYKTPRWFDNDDQYESHMTSRRLDKEYRHSDYHEYEEKDSCDCTLARNLVGGYHDFDEDFFVAGAPAPFRYEKIANVRYDLEYYGLGTFSTSNTNCAEACSETRGCIGYSLGKGGGNAGFCFLTGVAAGVPVQDSDFDFYMDSTSRLYSHYSLATLTGVTISSPSVTSEECSQQCDADPSCVAFVAQGDACTLKSTAEEPVPSTGDSFAIPYRRLYNVSFGLDYASGYDLASYDVTFLARCFELCDLTPGCEGVSHSLFVNSSSNASISTTIDFTDFESGFCSYLNHHDSKRVQEHDEDDDKDRDIVPFTTPNPPLISCTLKYGLVLPAVENNETNIYIATRARNYTLVSGTEYFGTTLMDYGNSLPSAQCFYKCDTTPGCVAFAIPSDSLYGCVLKKFLANETPNPKVNFFVIPGTPVYPFVFKENVNYGYVGYELATYYSIDENCGAKCIETPGCEGFSLGKTGVSKDYCTLQGIAVVPAVATPDFDFFISPFARLYEARPNIDYPFNDVAVYDASTPSTQCAQLCDLADGCVGFNAPVTNLGCSLKHILSGTKNSSADHTTTFVIPGTHVYDYVYTDHSAYPANSYDLAVVPAGVSCVLSCATTEGCVGFSKGIAAGNQGQCQLKGLLLAPSGASTDTDFYRDVSANSYVVLEKQSSPDATLVDLGPTFPSNQCAQTCDGYVGCVAFQVHAYDSYGCILKGISVNIVADDNANTYVTAGHMIYELTPNTDHPGNDIKIVNTTDLSLCGRVCDLTPECIAFNFNPTVGCALKSVLTGAVVDYTREFYKVRGTPVFEYDYYPSTTFVYFAQDIASTIYNSSTNCAKVCDFVSGCVAFTIGETNKCNLKGLLVGSPSRNAQFDLFVRPGTRFYTEQSQTDFISDFENVTSLASNECGQLCDEVAVCDGFSANPCTLRGGISPVAIPSTSSFFSPIPARDYTLYSATNYAYGTLQVFFASSSVAQCSAACDAITGCVGFTFGLQDSGAQDYCFLKSVLVPSSATSRRLTPEVSFDLYVIGSARLYTYYPQKDFFGYVLQDFGPSYPSAQCSSQCDLAGSSCVGYSVTRSGLNKGFGCKLIAVATGGLVEPLVDTYLVQDTPVYNYTLVQNANYGSYADISFAVGVQDVPSVSCAEICLATADCSGYSVSKTTGFCTLKGHLIGPPDDSDDFDFYGDVNAVLLTTDSNAVPRRSYEFCPGKRYVNNDVNEMGGFVTADPEICLSYCDAIDGCIGVLYSTLDDICLFQSILQSGDVLFGSYFDFYQAGAVTTSRRLLSTEVSASEQLTHAGLELQTTALSNHQEYGFFPLKVPTLSTTVTVLDMTALNSETMVPYTCPSICDATPGCNGFSFPTDSFYDGVGCIFYTGINAAAPALDDSVDYDLFIAERYPETDHCITSDGVRDPSSGLCVCNVLYAVYDPITGCQCPAGEWLFPPSENITVPHCLINFADPANDADVTPEEYYSLQSEQGSTGLSSETTQVVTLPAKPNNPDEFCWIDSYGRGVGTIPNNCAHKSPKTQYENLLCYQPCSDTYTFNSKTYGYGSDGVSICYQHCPDGYTDTGLLCHYNSWPVITGSCPNYPNTYFYGSQCYHKDVQHIGGGELLALVLTASYSDCPGDTTTYPLTCTHWSWKVWEIYTVNRRPICPSGYNEFWGLCYAQSVGVSCPQGFTKIGVTCNLDLPPRMTGSNLDPCKNSYGRGFGVSPDCGDDKEMDAGLCYPKCRPGYKGIGPVCWNTCPPDFVACGLGCAKDSTTCGIVIAGQVVGVVMAVVQTAALILTAGLATPALEGLNGAKGGLVVGKTATRVSVTVATEAAEASAKAAATAATKLTALEKASATAAKEAAAAKEAVTAAKTAGKSADEIAVLQKVADEAAANADVATEAVVKGTIESSAAAKAAEGASTAAEKAVALEKVAKLADEAASEAALAAKVAAKGADAEKKLSKLATLYEKASKWSKYIFQDSAYAKLFTRANGPYEKLGGGVMKLLRGGKTSPDVLHTVLGISKTKFKWALTFVLKSKTIAQNTLRTSNIIQTTAALEKNKADTKIVYVNGVAQDDGSAQEAIAITRNVLSVAAIADPTGIVGAGASFLYGTCNNE